MSPFPLTGGKPRRRVVWRIARRVSYRCYQPGPTMRLPPFNKTSPADWVAHTAAASTQDHRPPPLLSPVGCLVKARAALFSARFIACPPLTAGFSTLVGINSTNIMYTHRLRLSREYGKNIDMERKPVRCRHCEYQWFPSKGKKPVRCPKCHRRTWDRKSKPRGRPRLPRPDTP